MNECEGSKFADGGIGSDEGVGKDRVCSESQRDVDVGDTRVHVDGKRGGGFCFGYSPCRLKMQVAMEDDLRVSVSAQ